MEGSETQMSYGLVTPCANCPFRTDVRPFITAARVREILSTDGDFPCHKTVTFDEDDEDGGTINTGKEQMCAGFLILLEHEQCPNQMMRIAERLGLYDPSKLRMDAPVYKSRRAPNLPYFLPPPTWRS
jgi:hypothetical protein